MPVILQSKMKKYRKYEADSVLMLLNHLFIKTEELFSRRRKKYEAEFLKKVQQEAKIQMDEFKKRTLAAAKQETDQILDAFDHEIQELQHQVETITLEKEELQNKIYLLNTDAVCREEVALYIGHERDLYRGEIKDILLQTLLDSLKTLPERSRRADVIRDVIDCNNFQHFGKQREELLKNTLKSYNGMNKQIRKQLIDLGLRIEDTQKHYKITYFGDPRYKAVIGKTPSDYRAGRNTALIMCKQFF